MPGRIRATPIAERIRSAYMHGISYHDLMRAVFPPDAYPRAWRSAKHGGPPGCAMAFNAALRKMRARQGAYPERVVYLP